MAMNLGALALHREGHGYRAIAHMLGIPVDRVVRGVFQAKHEAIRQSGAKGIAYRAILTHDPEDPPLDDHVPIMYHIVYTKDGDTYRDIKPPEA
jgi:hypothetical protein